MSGLEVLAKNTNLMVVGKPGSGKTTYLQRVVTECNAGNLQAHRIPVLIKLREFVEDGREVAYSLERYLERCWRLSNAETQLVFDRGRALVLLDGLDEVTGEDGKNIAKEIKRFARAYPQVQVIVTCRTQSQESRFERFDYVEVADFNEPQVRGFAQHWFKTVMGDESAGLGKAQEFLGLLFLEANKPIRELAITPILLSLTCAVFHQTGKFYSKRSRLYEEGLELLLEQWDKSREIERDEIYRDLSVERKLELLSYVAVKKFEQEQYVLFEQAEIEGYIAEFLGIGQRDSRVVLRAIESQHGLLIERSQKVWSFSHLTFQEHFIARSIVTNCNSYTINAASTLQDFVCHSLEKQWREVFLLAAAMLENAGILMHLMKDQIDGLLASDEKIQQFLTWVNQKSYSVGTPFKPAAVRAFYFSFTHAHSPSPTYSEYNFKLKGVLVLNLTGYRDLSLACKLDHNIRSCLERDRNRALARANTRPFSLDLDYRDSFNFHSDSSNVLALALTFDYTLAFCLEHACNFKHSIDQTYTFVLALDQAISLASDYSTSIENAIRMEQLRACMLNPNHSDDPRLVRNLNWKLGERLRKIRELLPATFDENREGFNQWWQKSGKAWSELLRAAMIEDRNIGHDWRFSDSQKEWLKLYFEMNILLIDCLDVSNISSEDRRIIEETLLLPIAEIEKRKREKAE